MERIRWSERAITFRNLADNPAIQKPTLVRIGSKAIVVGEKINGEFITASPCKVSGDRFDVLKQEIILSSRHTGLWRVISRTTSKKEDHVHRLTTKDLERIHRNDVQSERPTPRSYFCVRDVNAFELIVESDDPTIANGSRIERRMKHIEENTEFEISDAAEVEYTPSESELTSQDYVKVIRAKESALLQIFLPGLKLEDYLIRNRAVRVLYCVTKGETRKRHFLLEISDQPCEIRPVAFEGSTELRYLHSTQNLYDYMASSGHDTVLYVKLLRGDPPIKAIEFDGYLALKGILNGDRIPICRVEDLEITLVSSDLDVQVHLPRRGEDLGRSLSEVRAAEIQCMQLSLALLARHESEMYVTVGEKTSSRRISTADYNDEQRTFRARQSSEILRKHQEECERVFGTPPSGSTSHRSMKKTRSSSQQSYPSATPLRSQLSATEHRAGHESSSHRTTDKSSKAAIAEVDDYYNRFHRTTIKEHPLVAKMLSPSSSSKGKTNVK